MCNSNTLYNIYVIYIVIILGYKCNYNINIYIVYDMITKVKF